jgi:hypothetical protein
MKKEKKSGMKRTGMKKDTAYYQSFFDCWNVFLKFYAIFSLIYQRDESDCIYSKKINFLILLD